MVISKNITSENLIIVKELINNWQIASTSKKKKNFFLKNTGQLDPTRNPTQPATRLTRNPINLFKNDPFWPATRTRPDLPVLPCLLESEKGKSMRGIEGLRSEVRFEGVSGWELERKCKMFYQNFKCKIFYINLPSWFGWLKIFYFWLNILLQNKHSKIGKYFSKNILHQNKQSVKVQYFVT